jgi:catechol 2,3-dioxygenase-like lactoylglutathione lyase family enzyme
MSLGPILAATIVTADVDKAERVYRAGLGLMVIASGRLSAAIAAAWGAPDLAGARWIGLASTSEGLGGLRLVEVPDRPADALPLASLGWAATEISVIDVDGRAATMDKAGFRVISPPLPLGSNSQIRAAQFAGPDGEAIYVTDVRAYEGPFEVRHAEHPVEGCFIAVLAAADLDAARHFYETGYGTRRVTDRPVVVPCLTKQLALADGEMVRISSQQLDGGCLLEIDAYPPRTPPRPRASGLPAGVAMMTFAGPADGPAGPAEWPYRGRPTQTVRGAAGELIELVGTRS